MVAIFHANYMELSNLFGHSLMHRYIYTYMYIYVYIYILSYWLLCQPISPVSRNGGHFHTNYMELNFNIFGHYILFGPTFLVNVYTGYFFYQQEHSETGEHTYNMFCYIQESNFHQRRSLKATHIFEVGSH